jgi:hypothetical protein
MDITDSLRARIATLVPGWELTQTPTGWEGFRRYSPTCSRTVAGHDLIEVLLRIDGIEKTEVDQ